MKISEEMIFLDAILVTVCVFITLLSFINTTKCKKIIKWGFLVADFSQIAYIIQNFSDNVVICTTCKSINMIMMDIICVICLHYVNTISGFVLKKLGKFLNIFVALMATFDIALLVVNPFSNIYFEYFKTANGIMLISRNMYFIHISIILSSILLVILLLASRYFVTSSIYKKLYLNLLCGIAFVMGIYYVFQISFSGTKFDTFICTTTIGVIFSYFIAYIFFENRLNVLYMKNALSDMQNALFVFDKSDVLVFMNDEAKRLLNIINGEIINASEYTLNEFTKMMNIEQFSDTCNKDMYQTWEYSEGTMFLKKQMQFKIINDEDGDILCKNFSFIENDEQVDELTGFHLWDSFVNHFEKDSKCNEQTGVVVFDLNRLSIINEKYGREEGDRIIQILASSLMRFCPKNAYYVKTSESYLIGVCERLSYDELFEITTNVKQDVYLRANTDYSIHVQSTVVMVTPTSGSVIIAAKTAFLNLKKKNMLDEKAKHTSLIDSLIQMQCEADPSIKGHVQRTKSYCHILGNKLRLNDIQQSNLELLCLIHDIGKIGIPAEIANKTGVYTVEEWEIMKTHVERGYRIAAASDEFKDLAQCVRHHHECYDGTGYPDGLRGESIPLLSRIIAVTSAYEAMTNDRPYRPSFSSLQARQELRNSAGSQFDPYIVECFIGMLEEIAPIDYEQEGFYKKPDEKNISEYKPMGTKKLINSDERISEPIYSNYLLDESNKIISIDDMFTKLTGYTKEDIVKYNLYQDDLIFEDDKEMYCKKRDELVSKYGEAYLEHRIKCKDGSERFIFCYGILNVDEQTGKMLTKITVTDISNTARQAIVKNDYSKYSQVGITEYERDGLTGVLTLKAFESLTASNMSSSDNDYILCMIDIDDFKAYNEKVGHEEGDNIIKFLAQNLNKFVGQYGLVSRVQADRFVVSYEIAKNETVSYSKSIVSELWGTVMDFFKCNDKPLSVSIGATVVKNGIDLYEQSLEEALNALMKAKDDGKKCYVLFG